MEDNMNEPIEEEVIVVATEEFGDENAGKRMGDIRISRKTLLITAIIILIVAIFYHYRSLYIAAMVDGSPISRFAVIQSLEKASGKQALEALITQKLLADEVKKRGIVVTDADIDAQTKKLSDQIASQGSTLDAQLASQGVTITTLRDSERTQLQVEKMLGDKLTVTDADVDQYIKDGKYNIPKEQLAAARAQIAEQLKQQKMNTEAKALIDSLRSSANISYFVQY